MTSCASFTESQQVYLRLSLQADKVEVSPGERLTVNLSIENAASERVTALSRCVAIARGWVTRGDQEIRVAGAGSGCYPRVTEFEIDPRDTLNVAWSVRAAGGEDGSEQLAPGEYTFRVRVDVFQVDSTPEEFSDLEVRFVVR